MSYSLQDIYLGLCKPLRARSEVRAKKPELGALCLLGSGFSVSPWHGLQHLDLLQESQRWKTPESHNQPCTHTLTQVRDPKPEACPGWQGHKWMLWRWQGFPGSDPSALSTRVKRAVCARLWLSHIKCILFISFILVWTCSSDEVTAKHPPTRTPATPSHLPDWPGITPFTASTPLPG